MVACSLCRAPALRSWSCRPHGQSPRLTCKVRKQHSQLVTCAMSSHKNTFSALHSPYDKEIIAIAAPSLLTVLLEPLLSITDAAIVGRLGPTVLAGLGLSIYVFGFSNILFSFLMIVTTPAVAAAHQKADTEQVARITARGFWIGSVCGLVMVLLIYAAAPAALTLFKAETVVTEAAVDYTRARAPGLLASFLLFVSAGTFRGAKDTTTLALVGLLSLVLNLVLALIFVFPLQWGVAGAGWATTIAQYVSLATSFAIMHRREWFTWSAVRRRPAWRELLPLLQAGFALQMRNISVLVVMCFASMQATAMGTAHLAAHEILRQSWLMTATLWSVFSIASQVLVASYLGKADVQSARGVAVRSMQLAGMVAVPFAIAVLAGRDHYPQLFVNDPVVCGIAASCMPLLALVIPLDSAEKALEGALLGCREVAWVARNTVVTCVACIAGLFACHTLNLGMVGLWTVVRCITIGRMIGGLERINNPKCKLYVAATQS